MTRSRQQISGDEAHSPGADSARMAAEGTPPPPPGQAPPRLPRPPMVVGVDTSSQRLAVSLGSGRAECYDASGSPDERRIELHRVAREVFAALEPGSFVFCEEPLALPKSGKTTRLLCMAAGAIWAAHLDFDLWWYWADVSTWKKAVIGSGRADKDDIIEWCRSNPAFKHENREVFDACPDLYDAWAIRVFGNRTVPTLRPTGVLD
jgi:hypothetical protein